MTNRIINPDLRIAKESIKVWLINETISTVIGLIILGGLFYLDIYFSWKEWIGWVLIIITILVAISTIISFIRPFFLYKNWRYAIDEEFLQLKSGVFKEVHKLVPMTKIQSVETKQGPILRKYGLYVISIKTMGSSHTIPALRRDVAIRLRNEIAVYAKIKEVE